MLIIISMLMQCLRTEHGFWKSEKQKKIYQYLHFSGSMHGMPTTKSRNKAQVGVRVCECERASKACVTRRDVSVRIAPYLHTFNNVTLKTPYILRPEHQSTLLILTLLLLTRIWLPRSLSSASPRKREWHMPPHALQSTLVEKLRKVRSSLHNQLHLS